MKTVFNVDCIFILFAMIFLHIIDDFKLQIGVLNNMKQKKWWKEQKEYNDMYKHDYIIALITHSFSWAFMIMLPIAFITDFQLGWLVLLYPINAIVHGITDHLKANLYKINLIQDQIIHYIQIVLTWIVFLLS